MKKKELTKRLMKAMMMAAAILSITLPLQAGCNQSPAGNSSNESGKDMVLDGRYQQLNDKADGYVLVFSYGDDEIIVYQAGLYDLGYGYKGTPRNIKHERSSVSFDCLLSSLPGVGEDKDVPSHFTLTAQPNGLYELEISFDETSSRGLDVIEGRTTLFKAEEGMLEGTVPAKPGEKVSVAGLIRAVTPYVFTPQMLATRHYLKTRKGLENTEVVRQDERNRYLEYAWGEEGACMECKYWNTDDGKILFVVNMHDATYECPQDLRFFILDPEKGTMYQARTVMSDKWPVGEKANERGISYQVRYGSDGLIALVPQVNGDSLDPITLKWDGQIFK